MRRSIVRSSKTDFLRTIKTESPLVFIEMKALTGARMGETSWRRHITIEEDVGR